MAPFPTKRRSSSSTSSATYPPPPSSHSSRTPSPPPLPTKEQDRKGTYGKIGVPKDGVMRVGGKSRLSEKILRDCLQENHEQHHIFFNDSGFHNHTAHHLLAMYSLGAGPQLLQDAYDLSKPTMKPMLPLKPVDITESNWTRYLGDEEFFPNYLMFFNRIISAPPQPPSLYAGRKSSVVPVVEKYLLGGEGEMLIRAVSGAIHPFIHIGYGIEFGLDAIVAEGLAQCAVHSPRVGELFSSSTWPPTAPRPTSFQSTLNSAFSSLKISATSSLLGLQPISTNPSFAETASSLDRSEPRVPKEGLSGFTILERIANDDSLAPGEAVKIDDFPKLDKTLERRGERIRMWCEEWKFSTETSGDWSDEDEEVLRKAKKGKSVATRIPKWEEIVEKAEELIWVATVLYAATSRPGYASHKLDFFLMHGLTSSLFLPSLLQAVSPHLRPYILQSHFRVMVAYWVARGRPQIHLADSLLSATAFPSAPTTPAFFPGAIAKKLEEERSKPATNGTGETEAGSPPREDTGAEEPKTPTAGDYASLARRPSLKINIGNGDVKEVSATAENEGTGNPWFGILQSALDHPDEHVVKAIRALAFADQCFGTSAPGLFTSSLEGSKVMDGSIFVRAAGITMSTMGWARETSLTKIGEWDMSVLGFDSAWEEEPRAATWKGKGTDDVKSEERADETVVFLSPPPLSSNSKPDALTESESGSAMDDIREVSWVEEERKRQQREIEEEGERELMA